MLGGHHREELGGAHSAGSTRAHQRAYTATPTAEWVGLGVGSSSRAESILSGYVCQWQVALGGAPRASSVQPIIIAICYVVRTRGAAARALDARVAGSSAHACVTAATGARAYPSPPAARARGALAARPPHVPVFEYDL
eukprot:COSAG02_NODE_2532_length_8593_cov_2.538969_11_plen_139_part_00